VFNPGNNTKKKCRFFKELNPGKDELLINAIIRKMQLLLQSHMLEEGNKVLFSRLASFGVVADGEGFEILPDLAV
jgi:hypothetical protein